MPQGREGERVRLFVTVEIRHDEHDFRHISPLWSRRGEQKVTELAIVSMPFQAEYSRSLVHREDCAQFRRAINEAMLLVD